MEEERRTSEELRIGLEKEREELRAQLRDATNEVRGQIILFKSVFVPNVKQELKSPCALRAVGWSQ